MRANTHYQKHLILETYLCIQSIFVTFQVENNPVVGKKARMRVMLLNVIGRLPFRLFNLGNPSVNLRSNIRMLAGKPIEAVPTNDFHSSARQHVLPTEGGRGKFPFQGTLYTQRVFVQQEKIARET